MYWGGASPLPGSDWGFMAFYIRYLLSSYLGLGREGAADTALGGDMGLPQGSKDSTGGHHWQRRSKAQKTILEPQNSGHSPSHKEGNGKGP